ncbi:terminase large subunit domain-containing protein [Micropruina sp.]|uniref:terminase large subunit domain-containing protein n=1 Tax=Micropruina sp. TaxID=2737536 RepID=UPI0039E4AE63
MRTTLGGALAAALDPVRWAAGLGFVAEPWQSGLMRTTAARVVVPCSRQVGKTQSTSYKALHTARNEPGRDVLIISPSQRQSTEMLLRIKTVHRAAGGGRLTKDNETEIGLPNGSRVLSLPGTEGTVRGFANVRLLIVDEAARVDDDVFASVLPMVGSDGQILALSTPWGRRGWFFELCEEAPGNGWERHRVTVYDSAQWTPERIAEVRASVGSYVFSSDYEAVFGDVETQVFATEDIRRAFAADLDPLFPLGAEVPQ